MQRSNEPQEVRARKGLGVVAGIILLIVVVALGGTLIYFATTAA